jgi:hypothetical protein
MGKGSFLQHPIGEKLAIQLSSACPLFISMFDSLFTPHIGVYFNLWRKAHRFVFAKTFAAKTAYNYTSRQVA